MLPKKESTVKNRATQINFADLIVGVLMGVPAAGFACLLFGALGGALGALVAFLAATGSQRHRAAVQQRIDAPVPIRWDVLINKVRVGSMADCDFAVLEKGVHGDWRVFRAQGRNLVIVCVRAARMLLIAVPVTLFWVALVLIVLDPGGTAAATDSLLAAAGSEIVAGIERYTTSLMLLFIVTVCLLVAFAPSCLGYENIFRAELGEAVRRRVQAAAKGRLELVPCHLPVQVAAS